MGQNCQACRHAQHPDPNPQDTIDVVRTVEQTVDAIIWKEETLRVKVIAEEGASASAAKPAPSTATVAESPDTSNGDGRGQNSNAEPRGPNVIALDSDDMTNAQDNTSQVQRTSSQSRDWVGPGSASPTSTMSVMSSTHSSEASVPKNDSDAGDLASATSTISPNSPTSSITQRLRSNAKRVTKTLANLKLRTADIHVPMIETPGSLLKAEFKGTTCSFQDFDLLATVGMGTFGRVRMVKMKNRSDSTPFALKIMAKNKVISMKQVTHILDEKSIMSSIDHPFIVNLLTTFQDERRLFMLMEFVNGGELYSYMQLEGSLPNEHAKFYIGEIVLAFAYLHSMTIAYRDLKPENCLIDAEGHIKITDFGFAKLVPSRTWTICGTMEYVAPEILQAKGHGRGVDWWALGVLMFEMLAGHRPFYGETAFEIVESSLQKTTKIQFPKNMDSKAADLIKRLLKPEIQERCGCGSRGAEDVQKHKWFKGVDWDEMLNRRNTEDIPFIPRVKGSDDTTRYNRYAESADGSAEVPSAEEQELFAKYSPVPTTLTSPEQ